MTSGSDTGFVICIENEGFEISIETRKAHRQLLGALDELASG